MRSHRCDDSSIRNSAFFCTEIAIESYCGGWGSFYLHVVREMFGGSGRIDDGHDGVTELFNLELDESFQARDTGKLIIRFCLVSFFEVGQKVWTSE